MVLGGNWFATTIKDELSFNEVIRLLCDHALIEPINIAGGYSMHTCAHTWVVHVVNANRQNSMARLALCCAGLSVPGHDVSKYWALDRRIFPHASKCLESNQCGIDIQPPDNPKICQAIGNLGSFYIDQDKTQEAEAMFQRALEGFEMALGPEHRWTLDTANNLGVLCADQGKMQEAEAMYQRALEGKEKAWGPEHTSMLATINNLGLLFFKTRQDAGCRGYVSAGAGRLREDAGTRAHVETEHI